MFNKNTKKGAFLSSLVALILCCSMFVGTTFAWFTDEVVSENNIIKSGSLDVDMYWNNDGNDVWTEVTETKDPIFNYKYWEPGYTEIKYIKITNDGDLAFNFRLDIIPKVAVVEGEANLADVIDVYLTTVTEGTAAVTRENLGTKVGTLSELMADIDGAAYGILLPAEGVGSTDYNKIDAPRGEITYCVALKMQESAGNEYQDLSVGDGFALQLVATQYTWEIDSFDHTYDDGAFILPVVYTADELISALAAGNSVALGTNIEIPAKAEDVAEVDILASGSTIDLNGMTLSIPYLSGAICGENVTIKNGTLEAVNSNYVFIGGEYYTTNNVLLENVTVVGGVNVYNASNVTLRNCSVNNTSKYYAVWADENVSNVVIESGTYNGATSYAAVNEYEAGSISITGGTFSTDVIDFVAEDYKTVAVNGVYHVVSKDTSLAYDATTLSEAMVAGGTVEVLNDIALENAAIIVASGVTTTLDLNGYTISDTNENTNTHNFLIDVKGGTLSIQNGTIEMEHTGTNMGWSGATTVIDVTAGGVLNLENVTVENLGGTDMNFAIHMNNWGEVTMNANNCEFKAPYCSVRVFNSGGDMNNVKITNSTLTGNKMAFWVHNYDSSDLSTWYYSDGTKGAYDKAKVDARLNLDIYGNNNSFVVASDAYPAPIRYGFNKGVYFTADGAQIVSSADELAAAVANGATSVYLAAGNYTMPVGSTVNLQGETLTISGTKDAILDVSNVDERDQYVAGANLKFEGVTLNFGTALYMGFANTTSLTYENCVINGVQHLYGPEINFVNCVLNVSGDNYMVRTWGGQNVKFEGCTFNCDGKALLVYNQSCNLTVSNCVFNDSGDGTISGKAAIEVCNGDNGDNCVTHNIVITKTTVNGFDVNPNGIGTNSTLWANKNSLDNDHLNVTIDGTVVY